MSSSRLFRNCCFFFTAPSNLSFFSTISSMRYSAWLLISFFTNLPRRRTCFERPRPYPLWRSLCPVPEIGKSENRKLKKVNPETRVSDFLSRGWSAVGSSENPGVRSVAEAPFVRKLAIWVSKSRLVSGGCLKHSDIGCQKIHFLGRRIRFSES